MAIAAGGITLPGLIETRTYDAEIRVSDDDPIIRGYAAVFNELSTLLGGFREKIAPGAFKPALKGKPDVRALFNHDPNFVLGRMRTGTLRLAEDDHGLAVEIDPPETQWMRDLLVSLKRGDISQMSFAFRVGKDIWEQLDDGTQIRTVTQIAELMDVSPVTYPAYPQTSVSARAAFPGIDLEALAEGDETAVRAAIRTLELRLPSPAAPPLALLRRKLDLLARRDGTMSARRGQAGGT